MYTVVAGVISPTRQDPAQAEAFASALRQLPDMMIAPLDDPLAQWATFPQSLGHRFPQPE